MKRQWSKLFVVTVAFVLLAGACAAPPPPPTPAPPTATPVPPTPTPLDVVQKYQDAYTSHDVDAAMALFTDDATYRWGDYFTTSDRTMIRNWLEYGAALNAKTAVNNCKPTAPTVTCEWRFVNDCFGAEGAVGAGYDMGGTIVFTVKEGKIGEYVLAESPDPEYHQWEEAFFKWLEDSHPMEIGSIVQSLQTWKFDRDFGQYLGKICKEHAASQMAAAGATSDLAAPVKAWVDALNSGDVDAALAPFTDDVKFAVFEYFASNKDGLRGIFDWLAGLETKYQVTECQPKDGGVVCTMPVVDACIAGFGATGGLPTKMEFSFQADGKISKVSGDLEGDDWDNYFSKWVMPGTSWMRANRPDESAKVDAAANRREAGAIQTKLCKLYGESLKSVSTITTDPTAPVKAWVDAINSGDVDAALALVSDDVKWQGVFEATGKEELRAVVDWMIGIESKPQITDCQPQSDRVVCNLTALDGCKVAFGASSLRSKLEFIYQPNGKVQQASLEPDGEEWAGYWSWLEAETAWAATNRAEEHAKVGTAPNRREAGSIQIKLCKEYGEGLKASSPATLAPKQVLLVAQEQSEDMELMLTKEVGVMISMLEKAGYEVVVASASGQPITGGAATLKPDLKLAGVKVDDYAGFLFPCMAVPLDPPLWPAEALEIAKKAAVQGKPIAAQIGGVVLLGSTGVLDGKQFALFGELKSLVPNGIYKGDGVVQDGNIITSGICPYMAKMTGLKDGTPELTQKLIDALAASLKDTSAAGDPLNLAKAYQDAFNRHDADGALALFIDQGFSYFDVEFTAHDKETLRDKLEYDFGLGATLEFPDCGPKGEALRCAELWRNDYCLKAMCGFDVWHNEVIFKPKDGQIQFMSFTASLEDEKACGEAYPKYVAWASANRPEEWKKLNAPAAYDLKGQPLGELESGVCKAYLEATKK